MPTASAAAARRVMRQIREIMASVGAAQQRLDSFVSVLARGLVADVCSVYLRRDGGELELYATEGLDPTAVHQVRLQPDEGLVGVVARTLQPLNIDDAPSHPAFSYQPQTREEGLLTFLGVPILRGGRLLGVLAIQNRSRRVYDEEEFEALQTAAMVLAEVVAELSEQDRDALSGIEVRPSRALRRIGRPLSEGLAIGRIVKHEPHVPAARLIADDPDAEAERVERAVLQLRANIDALLAGRGAVLSAQPREVLETTRLLAHDPAWLNRLREAARSGLTAEAAVERVRNAQRARLVNSRDSYLRERLSDLEDLADRLLQHLSAENGRVPDRRDMPDDAILVARSISPAALLEHDAERLKGVLLEEGAPASHAVIVAKALSIPVVGGLEGLLDQVEHNDMAIIDGAHGEAQVRPTSSAIAAFEGKIERSGARRAAFEAQRDQPAKTLDGEHIKLLLNAGLLVDLRQLDRTGAEGIGLFRTEFQFMIADTLPKLSAQTALYTTALDSVGPGRTCVFRTLDLGGDKILPYAQHEREENPALGWRALRVSLDRPALMRYQARALIAAAAGRPLAVMFPLVTTLDEFRRARELVDREVAWAQERGRPAPAKLEVGVMLETPAMVFQLDQLLEEADFLSVGANDLLQFFFAADRSNPKTAERYDPLSPPALRLLGQIATAAAQAGVPVTVCGEMAGRPLDAMALIALGYRQLSMPAGGVGPVKRMVLAMHAGATREAVNDLIYSSAPSIRPDLQALADRLEVPL